MNFLSDSIRATKLGSQILVKKIYVSNFDKEAGLVWGDSEWYGWIGSSKVMPRYLFKKFIWFLLNLKF